MTVDSVQAKLDEIKTLLDSQHDRIAKLQSRLLRIEEPKAKLDSQVEV